MRIAWRRIALLTGASLRAMGLGGAGEPDLPRVIPPVWASDDDLALLRKAGLL